MAIATTERPKPQAKQSQRMKWSVPRWSRAHDVKKLVPAAFAVVSIVRVVCVSVIVGAAICIYLKIAFPQIQLGVVWLALLAIPAIYAYLGVFLFFHFLVPWQVKITKKYICYSTGQSNWRANLSDIDSSRLIIYSPVRIRLIIRVKGKVCKLALPPTADLDLLVSLLSTTVVFDKRNQFAAAQAIVRAGRSPERCPGAAGG